jgi:hypothetical protein
MQRFLLGLCAGLALALTLSGPSAAGPDPREDKARELLRLSGADATGEQVMAQMMAQFQAMGVPADFSSRFLAKARAKPMSDLVVPIYVELLDAPTMDATITFYRSPAGQRFLAAQPEITRRSMEAGQRWGMQLGQEVAAELAGGQ